MYGHLPGLILKSCERTRWYTFAVGTALSGLHSLHFHGPSLLTAATRNRVSASSLLPGQSRVVDMVPEQQGSYLLECVVEGQAVLGMSAIFNISEKSLLPLPNITFVRTYFIQGVYCNVL